MTAIAVLTANAMLLQTTLGTPFGGLGVLLLCVLAGLGTYLLLPSKKNLGFRAVGGVLLLIAVCIFIALLVIYAGRSPYGGMGVYFWAFAFIALASSIRVVTHARPVYAALYFVLTTFATAGIFLLLHAEFMAAALVIIYAGAILVTYVFVIMLAAEATPSSQHASEGDLHPSDRRPAGALTGVAEYDARSREPLLACAVGFTLMAVLLMMIFEQYSGIDAWIATGTDVAGVVVPEATDEAGGAVAGRPAPEMPTGRAAIVPAADGETAAGVDFGAFDSTVQRLGVYLFTDQLVALQVAGLILTLSMVGAIVIARRQVYMKQPTETDEPVEKVTGWATPVEDNPHSIPVVGTRDTKQKAYPQT